MPDQPFEDSPGSNVYYDRHLATEAAKILPGEYYATARDMVIVTVLGSCVGACLRDRTNGIGGMNHFMLPHGANEPVNAPARYGTHAMELLIDKLLRLGARRANLEAKVFGGGNVLPGFSVSNVGTRNAEFVLAYLRAENIPVAAQDLLDTYPRKVYFFPSTGRVLVKKLRELRNDTIAERELAYRSRLARSLRPGDGERFS